MIPNAHGADLSLKGAHGVHMKKKVAVAACRAYVLTVFDTNRKSLPRQMNAEKGLKCYRRSIIDQDCRKNWPTPNQGLPSDLPCRCCEAA